MLYRNAMKKLESWKASKTCQGVLVTGARQVGKTTLIRQFAKKHYKGLVELNFLELPNAAQTLNSATDVDDLLMRISVLAKKQVQPDETLLFLDEIQECQNMLTWVKFLSEKTNIDVALSGSLLGIDAFVNVRSIPVGFLQVIEMYPLTFNEYAAAFGLGTEVWGKVKECLDLGKEIPGYLHDALMRRFKEYILVGGMPSAVQAFVDTSQLPAARSVQREIVELYRADITKYVADATEARQIKMVYDAIPSQLNTPTKRFKYARIKKGLRFANLETSFDWLENAGIAIAATRVGQATYPLTLSEDLSSFKFFMNDIGLMTSLVLGDSTIEVVNGTTNINYGSIYEAFVAQELLACGFTPHFYASKKRGEVDFVIENKHLGKVLAIEVKSGKNYKRHSALSNLLESEEIEKAVVLHANNFERISKQRLYIPIYAACVAAENML